MAARVQKITLKLSGINEVLRSAQPIVDQQGRAMAARAGDGFEYRPNPHPWTARGYVTAETARARRAQAKDAALTRAIDGGGS